MSAFCQIADISALAVLRLRSPTTGIPDCCTLGAEASKSNAYAGIRSRKILFNHVRCRYQQSIGERKPERLCSFLIQEEFYLCRFLDRKISGVGALQNLIYEDSRATTHRRLVSSIGH
jgi:hypothetical protein